MPTKFKSSQATYNKATGKNLYSHSYIKQTPKEELIEYLNNGQKPKIKQKCSNELVRRGIEIVWKDKEPDA
jgi:hypothetical protein